MAEYRDAERGGIHAEGLSRRYGNVLAVADLSLDVPPGTLLALLGPNGAGKTTTVRMLAALLRPTTGTARVAGHDVVAEPDAVRRAVGIVMEAPGLYEQMTARRYLDFFGKIYDVAAADRATRIDALLTMFELGERANEKIGGFSRGMKQKVALARALLHEPPVLFLDEPTGGLDPASAKMVRDHILQLKASNRTIVLCTHDLDEAERLADEVAIVRAGRVVAQGSSQELRADAAGSARRYRLELIAADSGTPAEPSWDRTSVDIHDVGKLNGTLRVDFSSPDPLATTAVVQQALAAGWAIMALTPRERSLEEVYLRSVQAAPAVEAQGADTR